MHRGINLRRIILQKTTEQVVVYTFCLTKIKQLETYKDEFIHVSGKESFYFILERCSNRSH